MASLKSMPDVQAISDGNTSFTADLHKALKPSKQGNLVYSPFSLSAVLAMVKVGAKGTTADEITAGLRFPPGNDALCNGYSKVISSLQQETDGYVLAAANRLYSQIGFELNPEFNNTLKNSFHAELIQLDFYRNAEAVADNITWVDKITRDKIKYLISDTSIVLANEIYFKGQWAKEFDSANTTKKLFHINEMESVMVDMMEFVEMIPHGEIRELNATAVALPYKGHRLYMLLLVPTEKTGLSKIEAGLKDLTVQSIFDRLRSGFEIHLQLPKFKLESTLELVQVLQKLGMKSMFDANAADFSGISSTPVHISEVIQKAFIEVDEEGSEAAAATIVRASKRGKRTAPKTVDINVPFFFQIIDTDTNFVLFSGVCTNPTKQN